MQLIPKIDDPHKTATDDADWHRFFSHIIFYFNVANTEVLFFNCIKKIILRIFNLCKFASSVAKKPDACQ